MEKKRRRSKTAIIAFLILAAISLICFEAAFEAMADKKAMSVYSKDIQNSTAAGIKDFTMPAEPETPDVAGVDIPDKNLSFADLKSVNEDIYAWIYVPGTEVDYPVLQHPTDDSFYLEHNIDKRAGLPGCIYTELINGISFADRNTVMYGHNMLNGTMFATLHRFADKNFFDENRYIFVYTPYTTYVYEIFAAYTYSDVHLLKGIDITSEEKFEDYIENIYSVRGMNNNFASGIKATPQDKILTLSTCTGDESKRYLVQGVLLNGRNAD